MTSREEHDPVTEGSKAFLEKLKTDEAFRARVMAVEDVNARMALIGAEGFDCSAAEIEAVSQELAESELEPVIGGGWESPLTCPQAECPEVAFRL